jgi:hypothetical protein
MTLPDCQIIEVGLPFTVDTDIVEVDLQTHFRPIGLTRNDSTITLSALVAVGQPIRCARFRRYTAGQTLAGLDALNVVLSTTPTLVGSVLVDGQLWHVFHEPTPNVPGMDDLIRRFATAPNTPPTAGGAPSV